MTLYLERLEVLLSSMSVACTFCGLGRPSARAEHSLRKLWSRPKLQSCRWLLAIYGVPLCECLSSLGLG